ncbi:hypothetical protein LCGC14_2948070 [marine sediment metagenome]|uniref:Uncharacterized protein n=1 Tax=marine sediment metagenome TaxID=412755 RepID=A0A0F8ZNS9_9ZZZZ
MSLSRLGIFLEGVLMIKVTVLNIRREWAERYMVDGRVRFRIYPELRRRGSIYLGPKPAKRVCYSSFFGREVLTDHIFLSYDYTRR